MVKKHVLVVGGGAAGMMAGISARRMGAEVTILERNPRVGKKILATGNGRCNFTNIYTDIDCYSGRDPHFASSVLETFDVDKTIRFFEKLGIVHKVEENGKVFPMSDQASSILDVFLYELNQNGIKIVCDAGVKNIGKKQDKFILETENGREYFADHLIIAAGGKALPGSGSDGNGFELARKMGHTVTEIFPALVQLMLEGSFFKSIDGVKLIGTAEIIHNGQPIIQDRGDILFTNYGVSGPPILQISRKAGELLQSGENPYLKISILDRLSEEEIGDLLTKRLQSAGKKALDFSLVGLINKRLIPVVLKQAGINDLKQPVDSVTGEVREKIAALLTDWRFKIRGTKGWNSAQVTAGGINTDEIDPLTMESRIVPGLYFCGEIIDIDGKCGGFNLQWCWSSGFVAGQNAAI